MELSERSLRDALNEGLPYAGELLKAASNQRLVFWVDEKGMEMLPGEGGCGGGRPEGLVQLQPGPEPRHQLSQHTISLKKTNTKTKIHLTKFR